MSTAMEDLDGMKCVKLWYYGYDSSFTRYVTLERYNYMNAIRINVLVIRLHSTLSHSFCCAV